MSALWQKNPIKFLEAFLKMSRHPRRYEIMFDREDLDWISEVWDHAAIAGVGDPARDQFIHERDRYRHLANTLFNGERERLDMGAVVLDKRSDWPHPKVIKQAMKAIKHAEIAVIH